MERYFLDFLIARFVYVVRKKDHYLKLIIEEAFSQGQSWKFYWSLNNGKTFSIVPINALPLENLDPARGTALSRTKSFHG
jgi:hypothetical protein